MHRSMICSIFLAVSPLALAATEFTDSIPAELAQVFIRSPGGEASTIYQDIPDDFPELALPDNTTVMGSVSHPGWSQTVALKAEQDAEAARMQVEAAIGAAGWKVIPAFRPDQPNVGFVTDAPAPTPSNRYCHDDMPGNLSVSIISDDVVLIGNQIFTGISGGVQLNCAEQIEQSEMNQQRFMGGFGGAPSGVREYIPRLELPEPEEEPPLRAFMGIRGGGPGGGSSNDWETQNNLVLDWSLQQVLDHFTPQLRDQGWELDDTHVGEFFATSTWTREVEADRTIMAILGILENGDGNFELKLRLVRQSAR